MAKITEDYVSFEVAKLLKEKGFKQFGCNKQYNTQGDLCSGYCYGPVAPTLQMAMKWLREVHTIDIVITPSMFRRKYNVCIYKNENLCCVDFDGATLSPSYEYACEAAIKYCLENLIWNSYEED